MATNNFQLHTEQLGEIRLLHMKNFNKKYWEGRGGKPEMEWDFSKWKQCLKWKTSFSLVSCMAAVPCWPPQIPLLLRSVSIAPPSSQLKKQRHRYLLQVRQPIKEEKQHFLTHLHHLEPHTADLPCSPSSGYVCSSMELQLWHNEKELPQTKTNKYCCRLQKGTASDKRLAAPLAAVPWEQ